MLLEHQILMLISILIIDNIQIITRAIDHHNKTIIYDGAKWLTMVQDGLGLLTIKKH
jgi:hypothetical protein